MGKNMPRLEWRVAEDEQVWQRAPQRPESERRPHRTPLVGRLPVRQWMSAGLAALLVLATTAGWLWYEAQRGLDQIEREFQTTVQVDQWAAEHGHPALSAGLGGAVSPDWQQWLVQHDQIMQGLQQAEGSSTQPAADVRTDMAIVTLQKGLAAVRVVIQPQQGGQPYRETRFYREIDRSWLRTPPVADLWDRRAVWRRPTLSGTTV